MYCRWANIWLTCIFTEYRICLLVQNVLLYLQLWWSLCEFKQLGSQLGAKAYFHKPLLRNARVGGVPGGHVVCSAHTVAAGGGQGCEPLALLHYTTLHYTTRHPARRSVFSPHVYSYCISAVRRLCNSLLTSLRRRWFRWRKLKFASTLQRAVQLQRAMRRLRQRR